MLDRDENVESSSEKLDKMIGLGIVKEQIKAILARNIVEKERKKRLGNSYKSVAMHMIFGGNPALPKQQLQNCLPELQRNINRLIIDKRNLCDREHSFSQSHILLQKTIYHLRKTVDLGNLIGYNEYTRRKDGKSITLSENDE